jgi:hypothetical protein
MSSESSQLSWHQLGHLSLNDSEAAPKFLVAQSASKFQDAGVPEYALAIVLGRQDCARSYTITIQNRMQISAKLSVHLPEQLAEGLARVAQIRKEVLQRKHLPYNRQSRGQSNGVLHSSNFVGRGKSLSVKSLARTWLRQYSWILFEGI